MRSPHTATREHPPPAATRESPHTATKTQCIQKHSNTSSNWNSSKASLLSEEVAAGTPMYTGRFHKWGEPPGPEMPSPRHRVEGQGWAQSLRQRPLRSRVPPKHVTAVLSFLASFMPSMAVTMPVG